MAATTLDMDLADPDVHAAGIPHALFAHLRRERPVCWLSAREGRGFWAVTSLRHVEEVSNRSEVFSSARRHGGFRLFDEADRHLRLPASILSADPPEHTQHRRLLAAALSAAKLTELRQSVRARSIALIEAMIGNPGPVDLVTDFAAPLTMGTFLQLIGAPPEDAGRFRRWSNALVGDQDPEYAYDWETLAREVAGFAFELWGRKAADPGDDLTSVFGSSEARDAGVTFLDFLSTLLVLIVAGNETTRNSLLGGALALMGDRAQFDLVAADRSLIRPMVQEAVRWTSPIIYMRRTATAETVLGEAIILPGQRVVMWYSSANFDETVFADAPRFDVRRFAAADAPAHIGFGVGAHRCIGRRLAEMQLQIAFEELTARVGEISPLAEPRRIRSNFINGFKSMPVALAPA